MPPVSVSITEELKNRLTEHCKETEVPRSTVISKLIEAYLNGEISMTGAIPEEATEIPAAANTEDIQRLEELLAEKDRIIAALEREQEQRRLTQSNGSNSNSQAAISPVNPSAVVVSNSSAMVQMLKERSKLYNILAAQRRVIELLKTREPQLEITNAAEAEEEVVEQGRNVTWYATEGLSLSLKLEPGINNVPSSQIFGILRACLEILEKESDQPNLIEATRQELIASSKDPSYKIADDSYNSILDEVAKHI